MNRPVTPMKMEPKHKPGVKEIWNSRFNSVDSNLLSETVGLMSDEYIGSVSMGVENGDSKVVGFAIGVNKSHSVEIVQFATRKRWEGVGVATKALNYISGMARNNGSTRITYDSNSYGGAEVNALTNAGFDKTSGVFHREL